MWLCGRISPWTLTASLNDDDYQLDFIALALHGKRFGFGKAIATIGAVVASLLQEQSDEDYAKECCEAQSDLPDDSRKAFDCKVPKGPVGAEPSSTSARPKEGRLSRGTFTGRWFQGLGAKEHHTGTPLRHRPSPSSPRGREGTTLSRLAGLGLGPAAVRIRTLNQRWTFGSASEKRLREARPMRPHCPC